jgi:hypothetical protein
VKNAIEHFHKFFYIYTKAATIGFGASDGRKLLQISFVEHYKTSDYDSKTTFGFLGEQNQQPEYDA